MITATKTSSDVDQERVVEQKVKKLRELYADAPELGRTALEQGVAALTGDLPAGTRAQSAGRIGSRQGTVSELTTIFPIAKEAVKRLRGLLQVLEGNFQGAEKVGTVHDMRFVFIDNDTKVIFATAYDGDWDAYIDDFATKIPNEMDVVFSNFVGWPGIRSPKVKDWIVQHQVSAEGWYVANPNLTVAQTRKLERVGKAVDELLDKIG